MNAKVRGGLAGAAMAVVVFAGVAVASSGGDEPRLEQSTVGAPDTETVETTTTTTVAPSTTVDEPVETTVAPEPTVAAPSVPPTTAVAAEPPSTTVVEAPAPTVPDVAGMPQHEAIAVLVRDGWNTLRGTEPCEDPAERAAQLVRRQQPAPGEPAPVDGVVLVVTCDP